MKSAVTALVLCLVILLPEGADAKDPHRILIDNGPRDLDGPSGAPVSQSLTTGVVTTPPTILASYDFDVGGCTPQGWSPVDLTDVVEPAFHIDRDVGGNLTGGSWGRLVPLSGNGSLWCGFPPSPGDPVLCSYATLPGYGNVWNQVFQSGPLARPPGEDITLKYIVAYDVEISYDKIYVEYLDGAGAWTPLTLPSTGTDYYEHNAWPPFVETITIPDAVLPPASVQLRFHLVSDYMWSDEDGMWNGDGAILIDDLTVYSETSTLNEQQFEVEAVGDDHTADNTWYATTISRGVFGTVQPGTATLQRVPPLLPGDVNTTCLWGFYGGSPDDYGCGGFPGVASVPLGNDADGYVSNAIYSPWIPWEPLPGQTTHIAFDVYRDLPISNKVCYKVLVRTRSDGGCPTPWRHDNTLYYGTPEWHRQALDYSSYVSTTPGVDEIQFALAAIDISNIRLLGGPGTCHSNAPLFDNVEIYLDNTHSWVVNDLDLWQDTFPGDGTSTGTIRANVASGDDVVRFRVTEPGVGMDTEGQGPAVFCHVKTLPGKAGAIVSGGQEWPEVPSMSDADWTVIQCASGVEPNEYTVDLNDNLYTAGDIVYFYFSARDANGLTTYYSQFTGRVDNESEVRAYPMEFTGLPTGNSNVLYVDYFSSRGAEPAFNSSFAQIGVTPDRFDVRSPTSFAGNGPGDHVIDADLQLFPFYDTVVWNTGSLEELPMSENDWFLLAVFAQYHTALQCGIYLSGDNFAAQWAASSELGATYLKSNFCDFTVISDNHRDEGEPVSPTVTPATNSPFTPEMIANGSGPPVGQFDVIQPGQSGIAGMNYSDDSLLPAVIVQSTAAAAKATQVPHTVTVVLSGFSHHRIADDDVGPTQDRSQMLYEIMSVMTGGGDPPSTTGGGVPLAGNQLDQNVPNPFNPTTQIHYSIERAGHVTLVVYDVAGRKVATLVSGLRMPRPGGYAVDWDGHTDNGQPVTSGVYFYKLTAPDFSQTRKMVLLK